MLKQSGWINTVNIRMCLIFLHVSKAKRPISAQYSTSHTGKYNQLEKRNNLIANERKGAKTMYFQFCFHLSLTEATVFFCCLPRKKGQKYVENSRNCSVLFCFGTLLTLWQSLLFSRGIFWENVSLNTLKNRKKCRNSNMLSSPTIAGELHTVMIRKFLQQSRSVGQTHKNKRKKHGWWGIHCYFHSLFVLLC